MSAVRRYFFHDGEFREHQSGDWVDYADFAAVEAERDSLRARGVELRQRVRDFLMVECQAKSFADPLYKAAVKKLERAIVSEEADVLARAITDAALSNEKREEV